MDKVLHKYVLQDQPQNDLEYWKSKSEIERLKALETLRNQYIILFFNGNRPRFQRVYTALKQV